jgi:hypothetical protein
MRSLDEKNGLGSRLLFAAPTAGKMFGSAPLSMAYRHGRGSLGGAAGRGKIPASQTTIRGLPQCT